MENKLIVSLSPHVHSGDSIQRNMYGVLIALIPALLVSFFVFGLGAIIVTLTSVAACLFFEWAITKYILKRDGNTLGMVPPPSPASYWHSIYLPTCLYGLSSSVPSWLSVSAR